MADIPEMEELQLQLGADICVLDLDSLTAVAILLDVTVKGLRKRQLPKKVRRQVEAKEEACEELSATKTSAPGVKGTCC